MITDALTATPAMPVDTSAPVSGLGVLGNVIPIANPPGTTVGDAVEAERERVETALSQAGVTAPSDISNVADTRPEALENRIAVLEIQFASLLSFLTEIRDRYFRNENWENPI